MQCYAAVFVAVTSFQVWKRVCKRARYSPARRRCLRGWKWPAMRCDPPRESVAPVRADAEAPHFLLSQSRGLVGMFRSIIQHASAGGAPRLARFRVSRRHNS